MTFAAHRVKRTGGTVVLMSIIVPPEFRGLGVEDVLRAEALDAAEANLDTRIAKIEGLGPIKIETVIREGRGPEEIETLIARDPDIAILVLAAGTSGDGPGPLVTHFASRSDLLPIPLTIVPGRMTEEQVIAIC